MTFLTAAVPARIGVRPAAGLALLALSCAGSTVLAEGSGGAFTPVSPMSSARFLHTATLLTSGQVLVAGGNGGGDSAELFDPALGTFGAPIEMFISHQNHTATLLDSGKVLVAGGFFLGDTAELFDGLFTPLADTMTAPRADHIAVLLPSGKVLLAGGFSGSFATNSAELFDPILQTFTSLAPATMTEARETFTATLLPSGKVLIAGGGTDAVGATDSAELFDPILQTFTSLSPEKMTSPRTGHTATLLASGKVLITGGLNGVGDFTDRAEIFDPLLGTFTPLFPVTMTVPRLGHKATLLPSGRVLITGGQNLTGTTDTGELFDPVLGTFTSLLPATMSSQRAYHTSTLLPSGKVLITGGLVGAGSTPTADLFEEIPVPVELQTFSVE